MLKPNGFNFYVFKLFSFGRFCRHIFLLKISICPCNILSKTVCQDGGTCNNIFLPQTSFHLPFKAFDFIEVWCQLDNSTLSWSCVWKFGYFRNVWDQQDTLIYMPNLVRNHCTNVLILTNLIIDRYMNVFMHYT